MKRISQTIILIFAGIMTAIWVACGMSGEALAQNRKDGRVIAEQNCARCHAIGRKGASPMAQATPFRLIHRKYPIDNLEESFGEGTSGNHLGMPDFQFTPREVGDLLGYIKSLSPKRR